MGIGFYADVRCTDSTALKSELGLHCTPVLIVIFYCEMHATVVNVC